MIEMPLANESSVIGQFVYISASLRIDFQNGRSCRYYDVPIAVYKDFLAAESAGKYFNQYIKGKYPSSAILPDL